MSSNTNDIYSIACDICDKNVTIVNKQKKDDKQSGLVMTAMLNTQDGRARAYSDNSFI